MNFEAYIKWSKEQPCVDCGKLKDGEELWATEIQCMECLKKLGSPEKRGKLSAKEIAEQSGVMV